MHASVGLYILEPSALRMLFDLVDMNTEEAVEFENILLPLLQERRKPMHSQSQGHLATNGHAKNLQMAEVGLVRRTVH